MIKEFINFLKNHGIIEDLIKYYQVDEEKTLNIINKIINDLNSCETNRTPSLNVDLLSYYYQINVDYIKRKNLGEIYTPISIVHYILDAIGYCFQNDLISKSIIDISCGSGSFLIHAIKMLIEDIKKSEQFKKYSYSNIQAYKFIISKVHENIFGIDINPIACIICQINIQNTLFDLFKNIKKTEDDYRFPIFKIFNINALQLTEHNILNENKIDNFDYVVGNPPYLFIRDIPEHQKVLIKSANFKTNKGQYDYYQLFIELGVKLLKNHGFLGFIVPDSLLVLSNRKLLRKFIYNNTRIKEIYHTGPEFNEAVVSNIILILQKEDSKKEREENSIQMKNPSIKGRYLKNFIQKMVKDWNYNFLINMNDREISILNKLNRDFPKLEDIMNDSNYNIILTRGIELGKDGNIIYCKNCDKYNAVPKKKLKCRGCGSLLEKDLIQSIIFSSNNGTREKNLKPYIESINRYQIKKNKFIDINKKGINYKDLEIYENRIIIRQISQNNLICATYDKELSFNSQSFYNLKINRSPMKEFDHLYLLGLINSHLLSFYFIKSFGTYKKLFPRILIEKIKQLPIKVPETKKELEKARNIRKNVQNLLNSYEKNIQYDMDQTVFELYNINKENGEYILTELKNL